MTQVDSESSSASLSEAQEKMVYGHARQVACALVLFISAITSGCATIPYRCKPDIERPDTLKLRDDEPQIERGKPRAIIDGAGHYVFSLPSKLILWNWRVNNHRISPDSEDAMRRYLGENGLRNVKVRLNQYAPGGEYRRLFANKDVGWLARYTLGVISVTIYTIFPERLFGGLIGGDHYNPYTNTISVYSDHPAILLHEAGHAKDFAQMDRKGSYAAMGLVPFVSLHHEGAATGDAIGYYVDKDYRTEQKNAYKILYPAYGTYVGGEAAAWFAGPIVYAAAVIGAIPGHIVGRIKAAGIKEEQGQPAPEEPDSADAR